MATIPNLIETAIANNFDKVIEGAKLGANEAKLDAIHVYSSEYNGDWSMNCEFIFDIGGTKYGKKFFISSKGAKSESELALDIDKIGRVNDLLLKAFEVENPNLISILQNSPVEKGKVVTKYNKEIVVDEYKPQQLVVKNVVVVMKKNSSGYFEISWMFSPSDKEGIDEAVKKAEESKNSSVISRPTSIGGGNRPSIGGATRPSIGGNRPNIRVE